MGLCVLGYTRKHLVLKRRRFIGRWALGDGPALLRPLVSAYGRAQLYHSIRFVLLGSQVRSFYRNPLLGHSRVYLFTQLYDYLFTRLTLSLFTRGHCYRLACDTFLCDTVTVYSAKP